MAQNPGFPWERSQGTAEREDRNESLRLQKLQTVVSAFQDSGAGSGLALDLLLHELAAEAQSLPFVSSSAIALRVPGNHYVCRAAAGESAPGLGMRIEKQDGLSAQCLRTGKQQVCHDTELDPRVDGILCAGLNIRSIAIVPLFLEQDLVGILEVFSAAPHAFDRISLERLTNLGQRVVETVTFAEARLRSRAPAPASPSQLAQQRIAALVPEPKPSATPKTPIAPVAVAAPAIPPPVVAAKIASVPPTRTVMDLPAPIFLAELPRTRKNLGLALSVLTTGLIAATALLWLPGGNSKPATGAVTVAKASTSDSAPAEAPSGNLAAHAKPSPIPPRATVSKPENSPRPKDAEMATTPHSGGLVVYEKGKVVFRAQQQNGQLIGPVTAAAETEKLGDAAPVAPTGAITGGKLIHRVVPAMPAEVAGLHLPDEVLVEGIVSKDGTVRNIRFVRGDARLSAAAIDAVQQWRYEPFRSNGEPVDMLSILSVRFQ